MSRGRFLSPWEGQAYVWVGDGYCFERFRQAEEMGDEVQGECGGAVPYIRSIGRLKQDR